MFAPGGPTFLELAVEALSSIEKGYDLLAPKFDKTPYRTPDEVLKTASEQLSHGGHLLDLCAGTGAAAPFFYAGFERITATDISREMLGVAAERWGDFPVDFVHQDVLTMREESVYDAVITFGALGHFLPRQQPDLFRRVYRALKPGGVLLTVTAEKAPFWSRRNLYATCFNGAIWLRNRLVKPTFVMYYGTFDRERAQEVLTGVGFEVELRRGIFPDPFGEFILLLAGKPEGVTP